MSADSRRWDYSYYIWPASDGQWYWQTTVTDDPHAVDVQDRHAYDGKEPTYKEARDKALAAGETHGIPADYGIRLRRVGTNWAWVLEVEGKPLVNGAEGDVERAAAHAVAALLDGARS